AWELGLSTYCRRGNEFENLRFTQPAGAHEPDKPILLAASFKDFGRVRQRSTVIKREHDTVCRRGNGNDAVGRSLRGTVPDDEEVVVVVHELKRRGQDSP